NNYFEKLLILDEIRLPHSAAERWALTTAFSGGGVPSAYSDQPSADHRFRRTNVPTVAAGAARVLTQLPFRLSEVEPGQPVRSVEDNHLSIANGCHVGARFGVSGVKVSPAPSGMGRHISGNKRSTMSPDRSSPVGLSNLAVVAVMRRRERFAAPV